MAGFKLMKNSPYMNLVQEGTLITNLNQGAGVPTFLENQTLQKLIAQSNYMNPRRMKS